MIYDSWINGSRLEVRGMRRKALPRLRLEALPRLRFEAENTPLYRTYSVIDHRGVFPSMGSAQGIDEPVNFSVDLFTAIPKNKIRQLHRKLPNIELFKWKNLVTHSTAPLR